MNGRPRGFTLMEVMVTVVVVGVAITTICQGFAQGTRLAGVSDRTARAALLLEELVSRLETGEVDFLAETEGSFGEEEETPPEGADAAGYRWLAVVEDGGLEDLYEVTLIVYWDDSFDEETTRSVRLVRYFYRPEEEEEEETP